VKVLDVWFERVRHPSAFKAFNIHALDNQIIMLSRINGCAGKSCCSITGLVLKEKVE
jgi:hypothetical protein